MIDIIMPSAGTKTEEEEEGSSIRSYYLCAIVYLKWNLFSSLRACVRKIEAVRNLKILLPKVASSFIKLMDFPFI